jgi:hypothetical protein
LLRDKFLFLPSKKLIYFELNWDMLGVVGRAWKLSRLPVVYFLTVGRKIEGEVA